MKTFIAPFALAGLLVFGFNAQAADSVDHFKSVESETLEQAVVNFSDYNEKLSTLLSRDLDNEAMVQVHELTYTLENALAKINEEATQLADTLEELHLASEKFDADAVKNHGDHYLTVATEIIQ